MTEDQPSVYEDQSSLVKEMDTGSHKKELARSNKQVGTVDLVTRKVVIRYYSFRKEKFEKSQVCFSRTPCKGPLNKLPILLNRTLSLQPPTNLKI